VQARPVLSVLSRIPLSKLGAQEVKNLVLVLLVLVPLASPAVRTS
jgi:hypothetical protein